MTEHDAYLDYLEVTGETVDTFTFDDFREHMREMVEQAAADYRA